MIGRCGCIRIDGASSRASRSSRLAGASASCSTSSRRRCGAGSSGREIDAGAAAGGADDASSPDQGAASGRTPSCAGRTRSSRPRPRFSRRRSSTADSGDRRLHRRAPGPVRGRADLPRCSPSTACRSPRAPTTPARPRPVTDADWDDAHMANAALDLLAGEPQRLRRRQAGRRDAPAPATTSAGTRSPG